MRPIDADEAKELERMFTLKPSERMLFRLMLDRMPTYEPPNDPLTLEELREMDGDPVWWENKYGRTGYGIVFISEFDKVIYIVAANRTFVAIAHGEMNKHLGLALFRRKPEEGTTWQQ